MGKVPNKPNKRRPKKKGDSSILKPSNSTDDGYQRFLQANAIRKQIRDNLGDIFSEISPFERSLSAWTNVGMNKQGACEVPSLGKTMEWRFHLEIHKYPEVWFRDTK